VSPLNPLSLSPWATLVHRQPEPLVDRAGEVAEVVLPVRLGFGRIVASEKRAPDMLASML
jgi:hypothetical protein